MQITLFAFGLLYLSLALPSARTLACFSNCSSTLLVSFPLYISSKYKILSLFYRSEHPIGHYIFFLCFFFRNKLEKGEAVKARTKIQLKRSYLIADSIFMIQTKEGEKELYCLEQVNGFEVKRVVEQLKRHVEALTLGTLSEKYNLQKAHRVLVIFEHDKCMKGVIERIKDDPLFKFMKPYFLLKTNQSLEVEKWDNRLELGKNISQFY